MLLIIAEDVNNVEIGSGNYNIIELHNLSLLEHHACNYTKVSKVPTTCTV